MNFYAAIHAKEYYKVFWYYFLLWYWNFCRILIFLSALWMSKPAANWNITTSSSIRRQIIISCSKIFFLRFLDISYWMSIFYVKLINCCTYVALLFFFTFFGGLRNIFGTFRWSKKWENEEFVEEVSETLIFILKKMGKNIVKIYKHITKM